MNSKGSKDFECQVGSGDILELTNLITNGKHDFDLNDFTTRLTHSWPRLFDSGWSWNEIEDRVNTGEIRLQTIDDMIHEGLR